MSHIKPRISYRVDENSQEVGNRWWFNRRATAWSHEMISVVVTSLSSLVISLSTAFSPLVASTVVRSDDSCSNSEDSHPTHFFSTDGESVSSFGNRHATSGTINSKNKESDNTTAKINRHEHGLLSSDGISINSVTASVIAPSPASVIAFDGAMHQPLKRMRKDRLFSTPEACDDNYYDDDPDDDDYIDFVIYHEDPSSDDEDPRLNKKPRLVSPSPAAARYPCFCKRKTSTNTASDTEEGAENNEITTKRKPKRIIDRQKRNHKRNRNQWETMFQLLQQYKQEHGNTTVPCTYVQKNARLGKWVANQRASHKTKTLSDYRFEMLDSIGFSWKLQETTRQWMDFYQNLVTYKDQHNGSTAVPRRYSKDNRLGFWVSRQRSRFRKNQLSAAQTDLLESIGFSWDARVEWNETNASNWMEMYQKLVSYKNEHNGSTIVPCSNRNKDGRNLRQLSNWVKEQRRRLRENTLPKTRVDLLLSIGVTKDAREERDTTNWMVMYQKLVRYKHDHNGSTRVPQRYNEDPSLGRWVNEQRKRCKKKTLVKLLDEIGFVWNARKN